LKYTKFIVKNVMINAKLVITNISANNVSLIVTDKYLFVIVNKGIMKIKMVFVRNVTLNVLNVKVKIFV